jgi:formylglycine-generating enzyme required for sulfatase activity
LSESGNVWEWCGDRNHASHGGAPVDGSAWVKPAGSHRVVRQPGTCRIPLGCESSRCCVERARCHEHAGRVSATLAE